MIPLLMLAAATVATPTLPDPLARCNRAIQADPAAALADAEAQGKADDTLVNRECRGLAQVALERFGPAAETFTAAAQRAAIEGDPSAANLWVQAGNAALAAGDAGEARAALGHALARAELTGQMRGEAHLDLARAEVQAGDPAAARADLDEAVKLVPADPMAWLLSATLARRLGDAARARTDIAEAVRLAPDDAAVAFEAGNVAALVGSDAAARVAWSHAAEIDPDGPAGEAAKLALARAGGAQAGAAPAQPAREGDGR